MFNKNYKEKIHRGTEIFKFSIFNRKKSFRFLNKLTTVILFRNELSLNRFTKLR